ncbi:hypothetical protein AJ87_32290 [Rhizobium yanglingense]|nr:hypothetical protein AJ87_32290 [Rhizobium yanglingense]
MTEFAPDTGFRKNRKLKDALLRHKAFSKDGFSERLFGLLFSGLVYPQIWEDPDLDMQAMELQPHHRSSRSARAAATCSPISPRRRPPSMWSTSTRTISRSTA